MFEKILNSSNNSVCYFNARVLSHPRNQQKEATDKVAFLDKGVQNEVFR